MLPPCASRFALQLASLVQVGALLRSRDFQGDGAGARVWDDPPAYRQVMENYHDMQYYSSLIVGGQLFQSVMDTGSLEFVVLSDKCPRWCGESPPLFHAKKSS